MSHLLVGHVDTVAGGAVHDAPELLDLLLEDGAQAVFLLGEVVDLLPKLLACALCLERRRCRLG